MNKKEIRKSENQCLTDFLFLVMESGLPKKHIELKQLLWKAFNLGCRYETLINEYNKL